jgi:uncharacterized Ntn-hydrolase superfamily protein
VTFSIVARSGDGLLGVASASRALAVGARCPYVAPGLAAIASQAYTNPYLALDAIARMRAGEALDAAITGALDADEGREWRQLVAIAPTGRPFAFTGSEAEPYAGEVFWTDCAAAGNVLTGSGVLEAAVYAFQSTSDRPFPERMLGALLAGDSAGGDRRGRQSAALLIRAQEEVAFIDLRVDDHADPIAEPGRLLSLMRTSDRERARWFATTRRPRPTSELRSAQERTRAELSRGR